MNESSGRRIADFFYVMKHAPERTCCACGKKLPQSELRRIAAQDGGEPRIDAGSKGVGRGAYLCLEAACVRRALQRKSLERALKLRNPLTQAFKEQLESM